MFYATDKYAYCLKFKYSKYSAAVKPLLNKK